MLGGAALMTASIFWGVSMVAAQVLMKGLSPIVLAHAVALIAAAEMVIALAILRPSLLRLSWAGFWRVMALAACGFAVSNIATYTAIDRTNATTALVIQYLAPTLIVCWGMWRGTERLDWRKTAALALGFAGGALTVGLLQGRLIFSLIGILAACASAFTNAFVFIFSKSLTRRCHPITMTTYAFLGMSATFFLFHPARDLALAFQTRETAANVALFSTFLAIAPTVLFFWALQTVSATVSAIILSFEVVVAGLLQWLWVHEAMTPDQIAGAVMVVAAVILIEESHEAESHHHG